MTKSLQEQIDELMNGGAPSEGDTPAPDDADTMSQQPESPEPEGAEPDEPAVPEQPEGEPEGDEPAQPQQPSGFSLRNAVAAEGYNVTEDADEATLAKQLIARLKQLEELAKTRAAEPKVEPAPAAPAAPAQPEHKPAPSAAAPDQPEPPKQPARKLPPLKKPEPELNAFVEIDPETKLAVPKEGYGDIGESAAKRINEYLRERDRRAQLVVENPDEYAEQLLGIEDRITQTVEARLKALQAEQEAARQAAQSQLTEQQQAERINGWFQDKLSELYIVDEQGQPRRNLFDGGSFATTPRGEQFLKAFHELQELNPTGDPVKILEKAYAFSQPMSAAAPQPSKQQQAADKKRAFVANRKHNNPVPANKPAATLQDRINSGESVSLMAALLADPANADNPALASLR